MSSDHVDKEKWDCLCEQCGLCCFEKIEDEEGRIFFTSTPCRYLNISTRRCKVFNKRFKVNPECVQLTPELVKELKWLHSGCGYKKALCASQDEEDGD